MKSGRTAGARGRSGSVAASPLAQEHKVKRSTPAAPFGRLDGAGGADLVRVMNEQHVRFLRLQFIDIMGVLKRQVRRLSAVEAL